MITHPPIPENEMERLLSLSTLDPEYADLDNSLKDLTRLAAGIAGTTISLVNLIDTFTQWSVARHGIALEQMPREDSVCQYTILEDQHMEVQDLSADMRFYDKDYVTGDPNLKYYFGVPLTTDDGYKIGALCVLDKTSILMNAEKTDLLRIIAREIVVRLKSKMVIEGFKRSLTNMTDKQNRLAHDIRGPIGGMIGLAQLFKHPDAHSNMEEISEVFGMIESGGQSVLALAEEILYEAKKTVNNIQDERNGEYNLAGFKDAIEKLYEPMGKSKNIRFCVKTGLQNTAILFAKNKLMQIAGNLISNAMKFTAAGGTITVELSLEIASTENTLRICVEDSGVGITALAINHIMNGSASSTDGTGGEHGYGLGLSLVKSLVESLDGKMEILSQLNEGTKFEIKLPQKNTNSQISLTELTFNQLTHKN